MRTKKNIPISILLLLSGCGPSLYDVYNEKWDEVDRKSDIIANNYVRNCFPYQTESTLCKNAMLEIENYNREKSNLTANYRRESADSKEFHSNVFALIEATTLVAESVAAESSLNSYNNDSNQNSYNRPKCRVVEVSCQKGSPGCAEYFARPLCNTNGQNY